MPRVEVKQRESKDDPRVSGPNSLEIERYLRTKVDPILKPMFKEIVENQPVDVHRYILEHFVDHHRISNNEAELSAPKEPTIIDNTQLFLPAKAVVELDLTVRGAPPRSRRGGAIHVLVCSLEDVFAWHPII